MCENKHKARCVIIDNYVRINDLAKENWVVNMLISLHLTCNIKDFMKVILG